MKIEKEIGNNVKFYRKQRKMTIEELAAAICKSKSCLSKYENGLIAMDITTLYDIARALHVQAQQLLYFEAPENAPETLRGVPAFFQGLNRFYLYYFDGRCKKITHSVADILNQEGPLRFQLRMYMNVSDYSRCQLCENTYSGSIFHYDSISCLRLQNQNMAMDQYQVGIPHPYMDAPVKWGLAYGVSSRPLMPTSTKVLISKEIQEETEELQKSLLISREDIRLMRQYNMLIIP